MQRRTLNPLLLVLLAFGLIFLPTLNEAKASQLKDFRQKLDDLQQQIEQLKIQNEQQNQLRSNGAAALTTNLFNPQIGMVLNGRYVNNSYRGAAPKQISGFELGDEVLNSTNHGLSLDETEISFLANVDNWFRGAADLAIADNDGESELEVEQAYFQTTSLPYGLNLKAGRFMADLGYLNNVHQHHDNFTVRPLPYQVFLNGMYNDDGLQFSWLTPTPFYLEVGSGAFSGNKFPNGGQSVNNGAGSYSAFFRTGGSLGTNGEFIGGISYLRSNIGRLGRNSISQSYDQESSTNLNFSGQNDLYIANLKYSWSPDGNNFSRELIIQSEYFLDQENGVYKNTDQNGLDLGNANLKRQRSGWYFDTIYKFRPRWRIGYRHAQLNPGSSKNLASELIATSLNSYNHNAKSDSLMIDFTNSEFSRFRLEYSKQKLLPGRKDDVFTLQYVMVIGRHPAHKF